MALNWKVVTSDHVAKACAVVAKGDLKPRNSAKGLYVSYGGKELPAKQVLRVAYCIATALPLTADIKFTSGDSTINLLRRLGFEASRQMRPEETK
jgi:hypothetical protein